MFLGFENALGQQWEAKCLGNQKVGYIRSEKKSKRVRSGTRFRRVGKVSHSVPVYKTKHWTAYHQEPDVLRDLMCILLIKLSLFFLNMGIDV